MLKWKIFLIGLVFLLKVDTSDASMLFFRPSGVQEDSDAIRDIVTKPGEQIEFRIFLDLSADPNPRQLNDLTYDVNFDFLELKFLSSEEDIDGRFGTNSASLVPSDKSGFDRYRFTHQGGAIAGGESIFLDKIKLLVLQPLDNNGKEDFELSSVLALGTNVGRIDTPQIGVNAVEVQPVPEPASLCLLTLGSVGAFFIRRFKI